MTDIPDAAELLDTARDALLAELVPGLSKEARYTALMIANAMAIATREARHGTDVASDERQHGVEASKLADGDRGGNADLGTLVGVQPPDQLRSGGGVTDLAERICSLLSYEFVFIVKQRR